MKRGKGRCEIIDSDLDRSIGEERLNPITEFQGETFGSEGVYHTVVVDTVT